MENSDNEIKSLSKNQTENTSDQVPVPVPHSKKKRFWAVGLSIIILALLVCGAVLFIKHKPQSNSPSISDKSLDELLSQAVLTFPAIQNTQETSTTNLAIELSVFFNPKAGNPKAEVLTYGQKNFGYQESYTATGTVATDLYNNQLLNAKSNGWSILYNASSQNAAVIEAQRKVGNTIYKVRSTYKTQPGSNTAVDVQYIFVLDSKS